MEALDSISILYQTLTEKRFYNRENMPIDFLSYTKLQDYQRKSKGDEDSVVTPILIKILEALGYVTGVNIIQQGAKGGDKPDFRTFTNNLFILDTKSTGIPISPTLSNISETPSSQIARYLKAFEGYKFGILFNLISFEFYERGFDINGNLVVKHLPERQINIPSIFNNIKQGIFSGKDYENYLWFFDTFRYREILKSQYIDEIKSRVKEDLIKSDKELLKATIYNSLNAINLDIKNQVEKIMEDSYEWEQLDFEIQKIKLEFKIRNMEDEKKVLQEEFIKQASQLIIMTLIINFTKLRILLLKRKVLLI